MVLVMSVGLPTAETKAQLSLGSLFMVSFFSLSLTIDFPLFFSDLLLPLSIFFTIFYSLTLLFPVFSLSVSLSHHIFMHSINSRSVKEIRPDAKAKKHLCMKQLLCAILGLPPFWTCWFSCRSAPSGWFAIGYWCNFTHKSVCPHEWR